MFFKILKAVDIPDPLFTARAKIYEGNDIKIKLNSNLTESKHINRKFHQGYLMSSTLFNIHETNYYRMEATKYQWYRIFKKKEIQIIIFADGQVIIAASEDGLQIFAHNLQQMITKYGLKTQQMKQNQWLSGKRPN